MRIEINVLPDKQKEKMKEDKRIGFALKMAFSFVAVLLLVNSVLYLMRMVLNVEYQSAKESSAAILFKNSGKESQLEKIFHDASSQVVNLSKISSNIGNWARVLARISELSPEGIRIKQLSADGSELKISGFSKTRDDFLTFQDRLKAEGFQFSVDISNLVASNDFDFDLTLAIPQDYLIRK